MTEHDKPSATPPVIILVEPQLGENIGAAARAMRNFGLRELRLVAPRDEWPNRKAVAMASGALDILDNARLFADCVAAVADLNLVFATTARPRELLKPVLPPRAVASEIHARALAGDRAGLMFGGERAGLSNDAVNLASHIVSFPSDPQFSSLNLGQSVLLMAYEWRLASGGEEGERISSDLENPASRADVEHLAIHLERELDLAGYFRPPEMKPATLSALRDLLFRIRVSGSEVRMLRGVVHALARFGGGASGEDRE